MQVVDANPRPVVAVGRPVPGDHNDRTAYRDSARTRPAEVRVEHVFARMKWWNILRNRRRKRDGVQHATRCIALMHNLALAG